ncbi:hypothetical protein Pyrfu_0567 [Pyrolobus fumarii 1A]|uniref:Ribbon-helix-helix protein CopG domain-containing protein n=1 Tax=Pyrolobus fumarii (strain DSM 11204 / 1A) TaxID=694429 RepID=G0EGY7_PYRF1|nr:ribbon-helix-helix protein, CopG family [Pyrolobus fumarii]AEM38437.1 hypothetical protein Pyrfu_0567 [Pyrolobus fumarii 1A]
MTEVTTIKVSKNTLRGLERLKRIMGASSYDEVIRELIREYRASRLSRLMGRRPGLSPLREEERLDARD